MEAGFCLAQSSDAEAIAIALLILLGIMIGLLVFILKIVIACKIFAKAGYCWALGFLMVVPVANLIMPFVLAFGAWPVQRELRFLKQQMPGPNS